MVVRLGQNRARVERVQPGGIDRPVVRDRELRIELPPDVLARDAADEDEWAPRGTAVARGANEDARSRTVVLIALMRSDGRHGLIHVGGGWIGGGRRLPVVVRERSEELLGREGPRRCGRRTDRAEDRGRGGARRVFSGLFCLRGWRLLQRDGMPPPDDGLLVF